MTRATSVTALFLAAWMALGPGIALGATPSPSQPNVGLPASPKFGTNADCIAANRLMEGLEYSSREAESRAERGLPSGDPLCALVLGISLDFGGLPDRALHYYLQAAAQNVPEAMRNIGLLNSERWGPIVADSYDVALQWYGKALVTARRQKSSPDFIKSVMQSIDSVNEMKAEIAADLAADRNRTGQQVCYEEHDWDGDKWRTFEKCR